MKFQLGIEEVRVVCFSLITWFRVLALHGCVWETEAHELMRAACDACVCPAWGERLWRQRFRLGCPGGSGMQVGCVRRPTL